MMVIDEETRYMTGGRYLEIDPPNRIVFAMGATDGWPRIDPDDIDQVPRVTLALEADGDRTIMTLDMKFPGGMTDERAEALARLPMHKGRNDTIDRLVEAYAMR